MIPILVILTSIFAVLRASDTTKIPWIWVWSPIWIKAIVVTVQLTSAILALFISSEFISDYIHYIEHVSR